MAQSRFNLEPITLKRGLNGANVAPIGFPVFSASAAANKPCQDHPDWMPRVFYPAFRGIIIRGIERRKIFRDNKDRDNLVERLEHLIPATNTACYAWAFLSN